MLLFVATVTMTMHLQCVQHIRLYYTPLEPCGYNLPCLLLHYVFIDFLHKKRQVRVYLCLTTLIDLIRTVQCFELPKYTSCLLHRHIM